MVFFFYVRFLLSNFWKKKKVGVVFAPFGFFNIFLFVDLKLFGCALVFFFYLINCERKSIGSGKIMVEFFSAEIVLSVC